MLTVHLMYRDRDLDADGAEPRHAADLVADLELQILIETMGDGDSFLLGVARHVLLAGGADVDTIAYRQAVLADALDRPDAVRRLYEVATAAVEGERKFFLGMLSTAPDVVLRRSVRVLGFLLGMLHRLRALADDHGAAFRSDGLHRFFALVRTELDDEYLRAVGHRLRDLEFRRGVLLGVRFGRGNAGVDHVLLAPRRGLLDRLPVGPRAGYGFQIAERDLAGGRALSRLQAKGMNAAADAVGRAADRLLAFFATLRSELAFYVAALNLWQRLGEIGAPVCLPVALAPAAPELHAEGLYDPVLALTRSEPVVANDVHAAGKRLVVVTGANQGGKSTFLRSIGLARLMTDCGLFVPARSFRAGVTTGVFTHYEREEDPMLQRGRLDDELRRLSGLVDDLRPGSLLLCNESFSATNEREGSEIAYAFVSAVVECGVEVWFVTHLFTFADRLRRAGRADTLLLRAERGPEGRRTFRIVPGAPLPTSFGHDVYRQVFGTAVAGGSSPPESPSDGDRLGP